MSKIGFLGLGKLGLPCALAIENKGHTVYGYDIDPKIGEYLKKREIPYQEEGTPELLKKTKIKLTNIYDMVEKCDIIFCAVQTPHWPEYEGVTPLPKDRADFNYTYLRQAVRNVCRAVKDLKKHMPLVIISTVLPGTTERELDEYRRDNPYVSFVYNPFFIAMGTTRRDFENPEFVLLGCDDRSAGDIVEKLYSTIHNRPVYRTSIANAEAIKVFYNTFISTKIAFANTIGMVAHKLGLDSDEIMNGLSLAHERIISPKYMRAGMGDGGGCHPRDNIALSWLARELDLPFDWFDAIMMQREKHTSWLADLIETEARKKETNQVVLCGLAFKKGTNLTVGSPALLLKWMLEDRGFKCYEYDPHINKDQALISVRSLNKKVFFISTNHDIFKEASFPEDSVVLDPWGIVKDQDNVKVIRIGRD